MHPGNVYKLSLPNTAGDKTANVIIITELSANSYIDISLNYNINTLENDYNSYLYLDLFNSLSESTKIDNLSKRFYKIIDSREELNNIINTYLYGDSNIIVNEYGPIENWTLGSNIKDLSELFASSPFNESIKGWNVENVTSFYAMFANSQFNQSIFTVDTKNTSNVEMHYMFYNSPFNQDISNWNVENVTNIKLIFTNSQFNQDISNWNVENVINFEAMFYNLQNYDKPLNWDLASAINCTYMFGKCQNLPDISNVIKTMINNNIDILGMFENTSINLANAEEIRQSYTTILYDNGFSIDSIQSSQLPETDDIQFASAPLIKFTKIDDTTVNIWNDSDTNINTAFFITPLNINGGFIQTYEFRWYQGQDTEVYRHTYISLYGISILEIDYLNADTSYNFTVDFNPDALDSEPIGLRVYTSPLLSYTGITVDVNSILEIPASNNLMSGINKTYNRKLLHLFLENYDLSDNFIIK